MDRRDAPGFNGFAPASRPAGTHGLPMLLFPLIPREGRVCKRVQIVESPRKRRLTGQLFREDAGGTVNHSGVTGSNRRTIRRSPAQLPGLPR